MKTISVGARSSPLSKVQVEEILRELHQHHPDIAFHPNFVLSTGDKDQQTSLRTLNKTDFFTKEIDEMILKRKCRAGIHSAKDLPDPLPEGLCLAALTKGIDPSDSLVMKPGMTLETLPYGAIIATSSERREDAVRGMRQDLRFIDLRGTIGQRIAKLDEGLADGVVIAEAALIRLGLTHLNRIRIPGETVPYQGQLAVITRENDWEARKLFSSIDCRKSVSRILYLGLNPPMLPSMEIIHCPVISIAPRPYEAKAFERMKEYTHLIFTSQNAAALFFEHANRHEIPIGKKVVLAVGQTTSNVIKRLYGHTDICSEEESAEGLVAEMEKLDLSKAYVFWPHAAMSRPLLRNYLLENAIKFDECILYDTMTNHSVSKPDFDNIDELLFSSPSCVDAFLELFGEFPSGKKLTPIGSVTEAYLQKVSHLAGQRQ